MAAPSDPLQDPDPTQSRHRPRPLLSAHRCRSDSTLPGCHDPGSVGVAAIDDGGQSQPADLDLPPHCATKLDKVLENRSPGEPFGILCRTP